MRGRESGLKFVTSLADLPCMAIGADPRPKRFRLLVVNGYEVAPLTSGGQRRIRDVYAALVPFLDVELVTLARNPLHGGIRGLAPGLVEFSVPRSWPQHEAAARLTSELGERAELACAPGRCRSGVSSLAVRGRRRALGGADHLPLTRRRGDRAARYDPAHAARRRIVRSCSRRRTQLCRACGVDPRDVARRCARIL